MARRQNFRIIVPGAPTAHVVSVRRWNELIDQGLLEVEPRDKHCGRPASGVFAWLEDGKLQIFRNAALPVAAIQSSWRLIEKSLVYSPRVRWSSQEQRQRWIQLNYDPRVGTNNYCAFDGAGNVLAGV